VGRIFTVNCVGPWPKINLDKLEIRLEETDKHKLKLVSFKQENDKAELQVTSYKTGEHHLKLVQLVDDEHSVVLEIWILLSDL